MCVRMQQLRWGSSIFDWARLDANNLAATATATVHEVRHACAACSDKIQQRLGFGAAPQPAGNSGNSFMGAPAAQQPNSSNTGFAPAQTVPGPLSAPAQRGPLQFDFSFRPAAVFHSFVPAQPVAGSSSQPQQHGQQHANNMPVKS